MKWRKSLFKKVTAAVLAASLFVPVTGMEEMVWAAESYEHKLFFASDYQGDTPEDNLDAILNVIQGENITPELAVWCGDYTNKIGWLGYDDATTDSTEHLAYIKKTMSAVWPDLQYLAFQGNHDTSALVTNGTLNATGAYEYEDYVVYVINKDDFPWVQGVTNNWTDTGSCKSRVEKAAKNLKTYLDGQIEKNSEKPIIIATHVPMHWSARSTDWGYELQDNIYANILFDVINEAAKKLDIVFLFGHNHSGEFDQYIGGTVNYLAVGDVIRIPNGESGLDAYTNEVLNFTYMNAGYMGYENANLDPDIMSATIMTIDEDYIIVEKYSVDGFYEPSYQVIERNNRESVSAQIIEQPSALTDRRVGETENFSLADGTITPLTYQWQCTGGTAHITGATDTKQVCLSYDKAGTAKLSCTCTYLNEDGESESLTGNYRLTILPAIDQKHLEQSVLEKTAQSGVWTYRWDRRVYIDKAVLTTGQNTDYTYEYLDRNGKWVSVLPTNKTGQGISFFDGFYTNGLRVVLEDQTVEIKSWTVRGDDTDQEVLAYFTFDDEETGFSGGLAVAEGEDYTLDDGALYLDGTKTNWLNVTKGDGTSLLAGQNDITVSMDIKRDSTDTNWAFYAAPRPYAQTSNGECYMGIYMDSGITAECYNLCGESRPGQASVRQVSSDWMHLDVVYTDSATDLYVNGRLASHKTNNVKNAEVFGEDGVCWIGKAAWGTGEYFKGWLDDYKIIGRALTAEEIAEPFEVESLFATFDFDTVSDFEEEGIVVSGSYTLQDHDGGKAIYLNGNGQYLKVAAEAGNSILTGYDEITLAMDIKADLSCETNWLYFISNSTSAQTYLYESYLGAMVDDESLLKASRYNNSGTRPPVVQTDYDGGWHHVAVVYTKQETILYVDGIEAGRETSAYSLDSILGNNSILYLGKANWVNGEYYKGWIDNVLIAGQALSEDEIYAIASDEVYTDELEACIKQAVTDKNSYTKESWDIYQKTLKEAQAVLADVDAEQKEISRICKKLKDAKDALTEKEEFENIFADVQENDWFYDAVVYTYEHELMTGLDETHFGPYGQLSRAQFALILYRMNGSPEVRTDKNFLDIMGNEWYADAVLWAAEAGVVTGYTTGAQAGCFGPADLITREQMAVMMYRYTGYIGKVVAAGGDYQGYQDAEKVSGFAADAMKWAVGNGIITGKSNGTLLDPQGNTARSEAAVILSRYCSL